jgi:hypothetical protein
MITFSVESTTTEEEAVPLVNGKPVLLEGKFSVG